MTPIALPSPCQSERNPHIALHGLTLDQLYGRRQAIDRLIQALEIYEKSKARHAEVLEFTAERKCS